MCTAIWWQWGWGPTTTQVPCHPDLLNQVLADHRLFDKGRVFCGQARDAAGNGLATCPYRDYRHQRRLVRSSLRRPQLAGHARAMQAEITSATGDWRLYRVIDAFPTFYGIALRTLGRTLCSTTIDADAARDVQQAFDTTLNGLFRQMILPAPVRRLPLPLPGNRRYHRTLAQLHDTTTELVAAHLHFARPAGRAARRPRRRRGPARRRRGARPGDHPVAAGPETVAATLTWARWRLPRRPAAAEQCGPSSRRRCRTGAAPGWADLPEPVPSTGWFPGRCACTRRAGCSPG
ncbi:hypothetical protein [Kitasatospora griseola]